MSSFNAKASRAKRPCPIWVDAFQRDTQHLEADEIGAYFLILMAMWTRESCDFPDDDSRLARVSRVSTRLWKSRIGPALREFFSSEGGSLISKRLKQEAGFVEREVKKQSDRKRGTYTKPEVTHEHSQQNAESSDNILKNNKPALTADSSTDTSTAPSFLQPNNLQVRDDGDDARARDPDPPPSDPTFRERILAAIGVDPRTGLTGYGGGILGSRYDMELAGRWQTELGLTEETIAAVVAETMTKKPDGMPPNSFKYFNRAMQREAARRNEPPLTSEQSHGRKPPARNSREAAADDAFAERIAFAARNRSPSRPDFGFG